MAPIPVRALLLALLPLIALLIHLDGQRYDPGLLDFKNSRTAPTENRFFPKKLADLHRLGPLRTFDGKNLYEYINGHAEFFIGSGFQSLLVADYGIEGETNTPKITIDLYDMGKPLHAFGVLMDEAGKNAQPVTIGDMAFQNGQTLTFINGQYYGKLSAFEADRPLQKVAQGVVQAMGEQNTGATAMMAFPELGKPVATRFIKENYRGLDFLHNVLEQRFDRDGRTVQAFLTNGRPEEIQRLVTRLTTFLTGEEIPFQPSPLLPGLVQVSDPYEGDWFFLPAGSRLLGVFGLAARTVLKELEAFANHGEKNHIGPP